jgi:MYXO-CTERM domain-containing protein
VLNRLARLSSLASTLTALALAAPTVAQAQPVVRSFHPRIWINASGQRGITPAVLRSRCTAPTSVYARACRSAAPIVTPNQQLPRGVDNTLVNLALRYLLYSEQVALDELRTQVNNVGLFTDRGDVSGQILGTSARVRGMAIVYDWLYNSLPQNDRSNIEGFLRQHMTWFMTHEPADVFSAEAYVHASTIGLVGLALAGGPNDSEARRYLQYAEQRWKTVLFPALGYTRGWWHEGPQWFNREVARATLYHAIAWSTATDEDLFAWARTRANDPFGAFVQYESYVMRPDFKFPHFGDFAEGSANPNNLLRPVLDMLAWGTGSTVAQAMADETTRRLPVSQDYSPYDSWHQILFYEPARPNRPARTDQALSAHLSPQAEDIAVLRSTWNDPEARWIAISCGDWFSTRQHLEAGTFQVYYNSALTVPTGAYDGFETAHWFNWYAQRSIHSNALTVLDPRESFPNARMIVGVNDGGQRSMPYTQGGRRTLSEYMGNLTGGLQFDTGGIAAFEHSRFHDYVACDVTRAYNSASFAAQGGRPKVREVTRQFVFLRPEILLVFDRVESLDVDFDKRFVLHGLARPIFGDNGTLVITRNGGRLLGRTLLPRMPARSVIEGFRVGDMRADPLVAVNETQGSRVEVTAARGTNREYFLHVFDITDTTRDALPLNALTEDGDRVGVRVVDPDGTRAYTVLFQRTGTLGGEVRVTSSPEGSDLYRGALGAGGMFYVPGGTDAGMAVRDASVSMDGGVVPPTEPGCSCRAAGERTNGRAAWTWALALAGFTRLARRRKR